MDVYDRPGVRLPLKVRLAAESRGTRDDTVRVRHVEPETSSFFQAAEGPSQYILSIPRLAETEARRQHHAMLSYARALVKTGSERFESAVCRRRILFAGFVARI